MKTWIIVAIVVGILAIGTVTAISFNENISNEPGPSGLLRRFRYELAGISRIMILSCSGLPGLRVNNRS